MTRRMVTALSLLLAVGACDRNDDVPDAILQAANDPSATQPLLAARPTTQELMEGERVGIVLDMLPVRMEVPVSWKITRHSADLIWLEGPTPHSEARIALKLRDPIPLAQYETYLKESRRDMEKPQETQILMRSAGPMQIVERRTILKAVSSPVLDAQGLPRLDDKGEVMLQTSVPMRWWLYLLVPFESHAEQYELSFMFMTREQFDVDRPFLEKMLSTLVYIGPRPAVATTEPSTEPSNR